MKFTQNSEGRKQPSSLGAHTVTQQNVEEPRTMPLVTSTRRQVSGDANDAKVELECCKGRTNSLSPPHPQGGGINNCRRKYWELNSSLYLLSTNNNRNTDVAITVSSTTTGGGGRWETWDSRIWEAITKTKTGRSVETPWKQMAEHVLGCNTC